ncbi:MAG: hypothetical protein A2X86_19195 [Bdellovibrionales bacterium GWA2_49_15]|nr:MAG: hypothetical protein A2X86_19195 [Bdellovibrionales bacterium GWA2_49_15]HAZ14355.1 hypothetical protein [Bdellovibrionales bacterium]
MTFTTRIKKSSTLCLIIVIVAVAACSTPFIRRDSQGKRVVPKSSAKQFTGIKKKLALLRFFNEAPYGGDDLAITVTEEFRKEIGKTGEFIIDEEAQVLFGPSKEIYAGGGVKLVQLSRRSKQAGINLVIFGRIVEARVRERPDEIGVIRETKSHTEVKIEIKVFDVNANKEILSENLDGFVDDKAYRMFATDPEELLSYRRDLLRYSGQVAVRMAIPKILGITTKLDWVGRVAKIIGSKIYINAGRNSGLQISDILKVITEGQEVYDPETGALIGVSKGEIKGTVEIIDYFGLDGAIAVLHSGGQVNEGDYVQLY